MLRAETERGLRSKVLIEDRTGGLNRKKADYQCTGGGHKAEGKVRIHRKRDKRIQTGIRRRGRQYESGQTVSTASRIEGA